MKSLRNAVRCVFCSGRSERDNPYDRLAHPVKYATWRHALRSARLHCISQHTEPFGDAVLKEDAPGTPRQYEFALVWRPFPQFFRLRVNDVIRLDGRLGRVIRVTDCAAVVLLNRPSREFTTRFDKPVRFQPGPVRVRISANAEQEILNRKAPTRRQQPERRLR